MSKKKNTADNPGTVKRYDLVPKIICVIFALFLWIYVMDTENPNWEETFENVPVSLINTDELEIDNGLTIYNGYSTTVDITVRGRRNEVMNITADDFTVTADVIEITEPGAYTLPITVKAPGDIEVVSKSQTSVIVNVDKKETIVVPVKAKYNELILTEFYSLGDADVSVDEITVTGPSRYLANIEYAQVSLPDLGRVTSSLTVYASVTLIDNEGGEVTNPFVSMSRTEVSVTIPVYKESDIPLKVAYKYGYYNSENSVVTLSVDSVHVKGDAAVVDSLDAIVITTIDEKKYDDGETITVPIIMPSGVENRSGEEFVNVTVSGIGVTTRMMMLPIDYLRIQNPNGVTYFIDDNYIAVTLRGEISHLYNLAYTSIVPKLDLTSYTTEHSGTFVVPVTFEIDSPEIIYELGEYSLEVVIGSGVTE